MIVWDKLFLLDDQEDDLAVFNALSRLQETAY